MAVKPFHHNLTVLTIPGNPPGPAPYPGKVILFLLQNEINIRIVTTQSKTNLATEGVSGDVRRKTTRSEVIKCCEVQ